MARVPVLDDGWTPWIDGPRSIRLRTDGHPGSICPKMDGFTIFMDLIMWQSGIILNASIPITTQNISWCGCGPIVTPSASEARTYLASELVSLIVFRSR